MKLFKCFKKIRKKVKLRVSKADFKIIEEICKINYQRMG